MVLDGAGWTDVAEPILWIEASELLLLYCLLSMSTLFDVSLEAYIMLYTRTSAAHSLSNSQMSPPQPTPKPTQNKM